MLDTNVNTDTVNSAASPFDTNKTSGPTATKPETTQETNNRQKQTPIKYCLDGDFVEIIFYNKIWLSDDEPSEFPIHASVTSKYGHLQVEMGKLSEAERRAFKEADKELADLWEAAQLLGFYLHEIKDGQLYRETHPSFEAYCEDKLKD